MKKIEFYKKNGAKVYGFGSPKCCARATKGSSNPTPQAENKRIASASRIPALSRKTPQGEPINEKGKNARSVDVINTMKARRGLLIDCRVAQAQKKRPDLQMPHGRFSFIFSAPAQTAPTGKGFDASFMRSQWENGGGRRRGKAQRGNEEIKQTNRTDKPSDRPFPWRNGSFWAGEKEKPPKEIWKAPRRQSAPMARAEPKEALLGAFGGQSDFLAQNAGVIPQSGALLNQLRGILALQGARHQPHGRGAHAGFAVHQARAGVLRQKIAQLGGGRRVESGHGHRDVGCGLPAFFDKKILDLSKAHVARVFIVGPGADDGLDAHSRRFLDVGGVQLAGKIDLIVCFQKRHLLLQTICSAQNRRRARPGRQRRSLDKTMRRKNDNIKKRAAGARFPICGDWPQSAIMANERNEPPQRRRFGSPNHPAAQRLVYEVSMNDYWAAMMKINSACMKTATAMFQLQASWAKVMTEAMKSMQNIGASFDKK